MSKKIKTSQSGQKKDGKKASKKDAGLNCIGYPHDDPYGLIAAFKLAFGFNTKKVKPKTSAKDFYI